MKAVICGGGIAGLAAAHRLAGLGWEVTVAELAPGPRPQGYMIDFFGPGYEAATLMGLLPRLKEVGYRIRRFGYVNRAGHVTARMAYQQFEKAVDGRMVSIMRPDLEAVLREAVTGSIDLRYGTSITEVSDEPDRVTVRFSDGGTAHADLLIGADGVHSRIRRLAFGPQEEYLRYLGLHTAAYVARDLDLTDELRDGFMLTDSVDRQMGAYALRDGGTAVFTVHRTDDPGLPTHPRDHIRDVYSGLGWVTPRILDHAPEDADIYYDQVAQIEMPTWHRGRIVLLGDACGAVSLLAGQGASLAIAGAYVLGGRLAAADSVETALAQYEERWHAVTTERQETARRGIDWFLPNSRGRLVMRRIAARLMRLPGLDRRFGNALIGKSRVSVGRLGDG
ncbi:2-polyprenyl-6-methoxyphenol hydroxylase-like FAD-dependent oxidoreductase [Stackebrandtia albiflava]|uniref:2-polyprenyl-6-methoxyphenol hydroxylase-like FAD-dependent oxidoreductase n=1 Tax=Stackebrandtia albiflava TaxID=406432 RepID=A0A562V2X9_9ACTN|nr:FAD-dependent monooxygenase [Stackebrandtia albiflava]TWJ12221.1 2-polyprenyl-6-methoxyphenol hydroxylase-like FAD-dependent oxidoreductase [Stackebrandtia albiflava]